jgi:hypothetical protein
MSIIRLSLGLAVSLGFISTCLLIEPKYLLAYMSIALPWAAAGFVVVAANRHLEKTIRWLAVFYALSCLELMRQAASSESLALLTPKMLACATSVIAPYAVIAWAATIGKFRRFNLANLGILLVVGTLGYGIYFDLDHYLFDSTLFDEKYGKGPVPLILILPAIQLVLIAIYLGILAGLAKLLGPRKQP